MNAAELQETIIAEVASITKEHDLAKIRAFVLALKAEIIEDERHWNSLAEEERQRIIAAVRDVDKDDDSWMPHDQVMEKYREWLV